MNSPAVDEWISKAEGDYRYALIGNRQRKSPVPDGVCYHCQQCAEKYLKAYLISQSTPPDRTHNLEFLLLDCVTIEAKFQRCATYVTKLNPYSVKFRYPGEDATVQDSKDAVIAVRKFRRIVRRIMGL